MHLQKDCRAYVKLLFLLHNRMMENIKFGRERLKNIIEKEAEEEAKEQQQEEEVPAAEQQQDDDEQYDTVAKKNWCTKENA